jgi:hypothetical protein
MWASTAAAGGEPIILGRGGSCLHVDLGTQTHMLIDSVKFTSSIVRGGVDMKLN